ncbi:MAG: hypothetical protein HY664_02810 [Chloroflexi bacterium]|nr:hypothetical protein [Chloroflexota bacterium]
MKTTSKVGFYIALIIAFTLIVGACSGESERKYKQRSENEYKAVFGKAASEISQAGYPLARAMTAFAECKTESECSDSAQKFVIEASKYLDLLESKTATLSGLTPPVAFERLHTIYLEQMQKREEGMRLYIQCAQTLRQATCDAADKAWAEQQAMLTPFLDEIERLGTGR